MLISTTEFCRYQYPPPPPPSGPPNDNFPGFTLNGLPTATTGTNLDATKQTGEPNHAGNSGGHSVWFSWTAPSSGPVQIDTCAPFPIPPPALSDSVLGVYTGSAVNSLTPVASNDNGCGIGGSRVTFPATMGTTYRIAVDGTPGAQEGVFALDIIIPGP